MIYKLEVILGIILLISILSCGSQSSPAGDVNRLDTFITQAMQVLEGQIQAEESDTFGIAVMPVKNGNTDIPGGSFAGYVMQRVRDNIFSSSTLNEVKPDSENRMIMEQFSMSSTSWSFTQQLDGILEIEYLEMGNRIKLFFKVYAAQNTTEGIANTEFEIESGTIESFLDILPSNNAQAMNVRRTVLQENIIEQTFRITIIPDRGDGGVYYVGDQMEISVLAEEDCYIKIYAISADGTVYLLFPHGGLLQNDQLPLEANKINANIMRNIPDPMKDYMKGNWNFDIYPPVGVETMKVIAQSEQFTDIDEIERMLNQVVYQTNDRQLFLQYDNINIDELPSILSQGLVINDSDNKIVEGQASYSILE